MRRRGRILRDTSVGAGLLAVDDTQLSFTLEHMWKSSMPPLTGMVVDVEVDGSRVVWVSVVPEGQLAREQVGRALNAAGRHARALTQRVVSRFGLPPLVAGTTLVVGWFFLAAGSLTTSVGEINFTFWEVLGAMNAGGEAMLRGVAGARAPASSGIYGILAVLALAGPFVRLLFRDRRAHLAGAMPLVLMIVVAWKVSRIGEVPTTVALNSTSGAELDLVRSIAAAMQDGIRHSLSIGLATYASALAAANLAYLSVRRYLAATAMTSMETSHHRLR